MNQEMVLSLRIPQSGQAGGSLYHMIKCAKCCINGVNKFLVVPRKGEGGTILFEKGEELEGRPREFYLQDKEEFSPQGRRELAPQDISV
jgi:Fe-S-cluster containining protein